MDILPAADANAFDFSHDGRISENAFLVSTSVLFAIVIVSLVFRLYIRMVIQRQVSVDDGLIIVGFLFLTAAMGMFYHFKDEMYLVEAFITNDRRVPLTGDFINKALSFRRLLAIGLTLEWFSINMVKLSFLVLFKRLVDRIRPMVIYWWVVLVYTVLIWLLGISAYWASCEAGNDVAYLANCISNARFGLTMRFAVSQIVLDVVGDVAIVAIPIRLIWQVKLPWTQKVALSASLCLSVLLIVVTIIRASGLLYGMATDVAWETFWQYISAEVGLILSATTAFRAFFVARQSNAEREHRRLSESRSWYSILRARFNSLLSEFRSAMRSGKHNGEEGHHMHDSAGKTGAEVQIHGVEKLPEPPRALMTGIRSFIDKHGREERTQLQSQITMRQSLDIQYEEWACLHLSSE